ncbi:MAG: hypothetical protein AB1473_13395 [Thermodesulfobacteriota bacterium]
MGKRPLDVSTPMTYREKTIVFVEMPVFTEALLKHLPDHEYREVQTLLAADPATGDLIPGCKGLRKLRWKAEGRGKRRGIRILYYWAVKQNKILLLDLFAKNESDDLTPKQYKMLTSYVRKEYP